MFVLTGLGGARVPLQFTGTAFQRALRATPGGMGVDPYENIVRREHGVPSILLSCSLLTASAIGLALLGHSSLPQTVSLTFGSVRGNGTPD